jgi:hypothetical protein
MAYMHKPSLTVEKSTHFHVFTSSLFMIPTQ